MDASVGKMFGLPSGVVFLAVMLLAQVGEVGDLGDAAVLPVDGVVDLAVAGAPAAAGEDAGLVPDL